MRRRGIQEATDRRLRPLHDAAEVLAQHRTTVRPEQFVLCLLDLKATRLAHDPAHRDSLIDLIGYSVVLHELMHDASAATRSAEVAELAEPEESSGGAAAEALLKSAEVARSIG